MPEPSKASSPIVFTLAGMVRYDIEVHSLKALAPIYCKEFGSRTDIRLEHWLNIPSPIFCKPSGKTTCFKLLFPANTPLAKSKVVVPFSNSIVSRFVHELKAFVPIFCTPLPIISVLKFGHWLNALPPMLVTEEGISIDSKPERSKQLSGIDVRFSGRTTSFKFPQPWKAAELRVVALLGKAILSTDDEF